jgi:hypothetical protein
LRTATAAAGGRKIWTAALAAAVAAWLYKTIVVLAA